MRSEKLCKIRQPLFRVGQTYHYPGCQKKNALYLNVKVFTSTKILIDDTIFTSPTGEGTVILRAHLSHVNV